MSGIVPLLRTVKAMFTVVKGCAKYDALVRRTSGRSTSFTVTVKFAAAWRLVLASEVARTVNAWAPFDGSAGTAIGTVKVRFSFGTSVTLAKGRVAQFASVPEIERA